MRTTIGTRRSGHPGRIVVGVAGLRTVVLAAQPPPALSPPDPSVPDLRYAASLVASEQPVGLVLMHDELHVAPRELWPHLAPNAQRTRRLRSVSAAGAL